MSHSGINIECVFLGVKFNLEFINAEVSSFLFKICGHSYLLEMISISDDFIIFFE